MLLGMLSVGVAYPLIVRQSPGMRLRSVRKESDASGLRSLKSFSYVTIVLFFVSRLALGKDRGNMHGRWWIYVAIDGRIG